MAIRYSKELKATLVGLHVEQGHRITKILMVFKIPKRTYYNWIHWRPSKTAQYRYKITRLINQLWRQHPEYGYVRIAKRLRKTFNYHISNRTVWLIMHDLGIQSTMSHYRSKKPRTNY